MLLRRPAKVTLTSARLGSRPLLAQTKIDVGLAMPTLALQRWVIDGLALARSFNGMRLVSDLQFANNDVQTQIAQIDGMLGKGVRALIVTPIDGPALAPVLKKAADQKVAVISYDRLIRNSPHVDYYATFDNFQVGVLQATSIVDSLGLKDGKGPFNIELFGGSPDDNNAFFFYNGAMSVLQPYIDQGKLVIPSGQKGMDTVGTLRWDPSVAQARMDNLLSAYYTDKNVDAVLSPYDGLSIGIISSLRGVGYGSGDKKMPVITGQDAELPSVKAILAGNQTSTIFKDTRELAKVTVDMVDAMAAGKEVPVNDTKTYENGVKTVPSYLLKPVLVTKDNAAEYK